MSSSKKILILQSNYIPWQGYFDLIHAVDEFVVYDSVQYTKRDWRNRNYVKGPEGLIGLTIPVKTKGRQTQRINQVEVVDHIWAEKHFKTIESYYQKSPFYEEYREELRHMYLSICRNVSSLSDINLLFLRMILKWLGITTSVLSGVSPDLGLTKTEALVNVCLQRKASHYLSGPAAQSYIDDSVFKKNNICLEYYKYPNYKEYQQLYPPFEGRISILDCIFNNKNELLERFK